LLPVLLELLLVFLDGNRGLKEVDFGLFEVLLDRVEAEAHDV